MEKAKARAREFGKNLLMRAKGGSDSSEPDMEETKTAATRLSWSQVVVRGSPERVHYKEKKDTTVGMPRSLAGEAGKSSSTAGEAEFSAQGGWSGKTRSPQRLFTADDVAKLVEMARKQARKQATASSGWEKIETKESKRKERTHIRELVDGFQRSPESVIKCWQCNQPGHLSSSCPRGERCFTCNSTTHKRVDCPYKKKASREEKGKGIALGENRAHRSRDAGPLWISEQNSYDRRREVMPMARDNSLSGSNVDKSRNDIKVPEKAVVRKQENVTYGGKKANEEGKIHQLEARPRVAQPVFVQQSERSVEEKQSMAKLGGVICKANGSPTIKDYVDALEKKCALRTLLGIGGRCR